MFIIFVQYSTRPICDVSMNLFCWPPSVDIFNFLPGFLWQALLSDKNIINMSNVRRCGGWVIKLQFGYKGGLDQ